jgi:ribosomal protein L37AE/L43A
MCTHKRIEVVLMGDSVWVCEECGEELPDLEVSAMEL